MAWQNGGLAIAVVAILAVGAANWPDHAGGKDTSITPVVPTSSQVTLDYPSTISTVSGPDYGSGRPLGDGGGAVAFQADDRLDQIFLNTGLCTADSSEWVFQMSNFTTGSGYTNNFDVYINGMKVGSYSFAPGDGNPVNFDLIFTHPGLAVGSARLSIVATSTVPGGDGAWNWIAGGTVTLSGTAGPCCVRAPAGMIAWWKGEGDAKDSQEDHNGTNNGATFTSGEVGQAFTFDGTDDNVSIPDSADWNFGTGDFTFDFWEKSSVSAENREYALSFDPVPDTTNLEFNFNDADVGLWVYWNGGGPIGTNAIQVGTGGQYTDDQWHHIALTRSGSTLTLYIDGLAVGTADYSDPIDLSGGNNNYLGKYAGNDFFWNGQIDEVEVFKHALSADEVASIYSASSAGKCPCTPAPDGMISWWRADGDGVDTQDGNHLSFTNGEAYGSGEVGQAFSFNGSNSASAGNPSNLDITGDQVTIDGWINPSSELRYRVLVFWQRRGRRQPPVRFAMGSRQPRWPDQ